jgi:hypothetical protein
LCCPLHDFFSFSHNSEERACNARF